MKNHPIIYLNSNDGSGILAFGKGPEFILGKSQSLDEIQAFIDQHSGRYIFSCLSYDLKNQIFDLSSENSDALHFPDAIFWAPEFVVQIDGSEQKYLLGERSGESDDFIDHFFAEMNEPPPQLGANFQPRIDRKEYLKTVNELKGELQQGNIYEINFCQEFYAQGVDLPHPIRTYNRLNQITRAPFSGFISIDKFQIFSGSPERYIKRIGNKVISQPIKGTQKRGASEAEDEALKASLLNNPKERSENVMIVDLVRNDLSRIATPNSVRVDELFGIYTFETVHQMISTISCEVTESTSFTDILRASYPMGSMTGAPKYSAMELIEKHESFKRGIYSGAIGYIAPNGDFDLNVIIRTMIYNTETQYLSCSVGGAITIQSSPESEFEECNIKVQSILKGMNGKY